MSSRSATRRKRQELAKRKAAAERRERRNNAYNASRRLLNADMDATMPTAEGQQAKGGTQASAGDAAGMTAANGSNDDDGKAKAPRTTGRQAKGNPKQGKRSQDEEGGKGKAHDADGKSVRNERELALERQRDRYDRRKKRHKGVVIAVATVCAASMVLPIGAAAISAIMEGRMYDQNVQVITNDGSPTMSVDGVTDDDAYAGIAGSAYTDDSATGGSSDGSTGDATTTDGDAASSAGSPSATGNADSATDGSAND